MNILKAFFGNYSKRELKRIRPICDKVLALENKYLNMSDEELADQTNVLKGRLSKGETLDDILPDAFAVCREASDRVLGMRHFPVQIIGGIVLHQGRISEMRTGEGKTLVVTLPAYLNALSEKGVHVITVNDYLARRDSEWMGKLYSFLGLSVGLIVHEMNDQERKEAYAADITYGTNNEFGFDYLRDNMVSSKDSKVQRKHNYAIIDEVDSILIDEARTPLIISGQGDKSTDLYLLADRFARTLNMTKVAELDSKEDNDELYKDADFVVDEKAKTATLTPGGVKKAEEYFHVDNLTDADNITLSHHINQAIKAHGTMQRDIDYVVKDGEVVIVDEFTGRLMNGRRYSDGLHQAIEAKENVKVNRESKTLATITFQNYFRLYPKLSGTTGTAMTEEAEFREIYKLDVVEIPPNKPVQRIDSPDIVYKTEKAKFNAVIDEVAKAHEKGQPVLVGTISIEKSEILSGLLKRRGIKHNVLNAKNHEREAEIVAQAGKKDAVTIATNMAGRGTDIILGGNAEFLAKTELRKRGYADELILEANSFSVTDDPDVLKIRKEYADLHAKFKEKLKPDAEEVRSCGGLYIIGTERHDSRRIDNQLRGRAGRQGDPGRSQFFLSLEDDLMRLFGGERVKNMMDRFKIDDDVPIDSKMVSNSIEVAQRRIEGQNFAIRKNVLQYDDVMSRQREIIYSQRDQVLEGEDIHQKIITMIEQAIDDTIARYIPKDSFKEEWNIEGLKDYYLGWLLDGDDLNYSPEDRETLEINAISEFIKKKALDIYSKREQDLGPELMRELERVVLLQNVDSNWMEHIDAMEELKRGIRLRAYAQRDPVVEYRMESYDMFDEMIATIRKDTAKIMLTLNISHLIPGIGSSYDADSTYMNDDFDMMPFEFYDDMAEEIDMNAPCPCGSGKKYKNCCGRYENM